jgi:flagellar basal-body rod protein FlgF
MSENMQLISLSRATALQRQMDVVANNLANINTTGFKAENLLFEEYRMPVAADRDLPHGSQQLSYTEDWATIHDFRPGPVMQTGNPLDVALQGPGFLTVQTPTGVRYTKAGALDIDASGQLVDLNGYPVLGEGGPIRFDPSETNITIGADGAISSSAGGKGKLAIAEFADPAALTRDGQNLWTGGAAIPATETRLIQGAIERSNVSGVREMTQMIQVQRAYETLARLMQSQSDLRNTAVQQLGTLTLA